MIRPKPTIFLVHLPNTKTQNKKPRPRLIQEARMLFNDFAYIPYIYPDFLTKLRLGGANFIPIILSYVIRTVY